METDWVVGEVMQELAERSAPKDTLFLFTTDNGCSPAAGIQNSSPRDTNPMEIGAVTRLTSMKEAIVCHLLCAGLPV